MSQTWRRRSRGEEGHMVKRLLPSKEELQKGVSRAKEGGDGVCGGT